MGGMMSGQELQTIRKRLMGGKAVKRSQGWCPGGNQTLPRGVKFIRERDQQTGRTLSVKWAHDGKDSERMKKAFALFLEGDSYQTIAEKIGGGYSDNGVRNSLMNPLWIGIRRYEWACDGEERATVSRETGAPGKPRKRARRVAEPLEVPVDLAPIVSREVFDRVQRIIEERKTRWRKSKTPPRMLLSGLLRCGCGRAMYSRSSVRGRGKDTYICASRVPKGDGCGRGFEYRADLEAAIGDIIAECLLNREFIKSVFGKVREVRKAKSPGASLEAAIRKLKLGRERLIDVATDPDVNMSKAAFKERLQKIDREIAEVERLAPAEANGQRDDAAYLARWIAELFSEYDLLQFAERRLLLQRAFKWVTVDRRKILSITFDGGFLSEIANKNAGANSRRRVTTPSRVSTVEDFTLHFPKPFVIAALAERPT
jgi:hypothetical protein